MMTAAAFIAGDWGTSHLRLGLCDVQGRVLDARQGPGVAALKGDFSACFAQLTDVWMQQHGVLPAVLCGMVGSSLGWVSVPYLPCPAKPEAIAQAAQRLHGERITIAPGLACRNPNDAPDFMRGEETQVLGALRLNPHLRNGRQLLCLPGTHTKWVVLEDGEIRQFLTAVTGELFAVIKQHSVLVRAAGSRAAVGLIFQRAMRHAMQYPDASLQQLLFECRSRQLDGELLPDDAATFLSGLLIATDVMGALRVFRELSTAATSVTLIGTGQLTQHYAAVCDAHDIRSTQLDGGSASLAGLTAIYAELYNT